MAIYYEAHITMEGDKTFLEDVVSKLQGWRFSSIDGDINLGVGVKCYATKQFNGKLSSDAVLAFLHSAADGLITAYNVKVLRRKVELVIYDDRSSKVDCTATECSTCPSIST